MAVDFESRDIPVESRVGFDEVVKLAESIPNVFGGKFFGGVGVQEIFLFGHPAVDELMKRAVAKLQWDVVGLAHPVHQ